MHIEQNNLYPLHIYRGIPTQKSISRVRKKYTPPIAFGNNALWAVAKVNTTSSEVTRLKTFDIIESK